MFTVSGEHSDKCLEESLLFLSRKTITVTVNFLLLVFKCNCFTLQNQKTKCLVLSRYPHSEPLER